ncbi:MAG: NfeD family protein [Waddliaceae bacterium]
MTIQPFLLLAIGFFLIFAEFYLPGGIMGVLGTLTVVGSIIVFAMQSESPIYIILYLVGVVISLALVFKYALRRISRGSLFSAGDQTGYYASSYDKELIGKVGTVATDLRPGGHIAIDGKRYSAISQSGYLSKGEKVVVIDGQGETLIVKPEE